jgi:Type IV pili methyl-accepting chemotaxis transducer N-term
MYSFHDLDLLNDRRTFLKATITLVGFGGLAHAQNADAVNAIAVNRAARIRAISQRIVKLKAQQLLAINTETTPDSIVATEKLLASHMQFLSSTVPSGIRPRLDGLSALTSKLVALSAIKPTKDSLAETNAMATATLKSADELATELQKLSKLKAVEVVNESGRERMLSQRMAKNYFLMSANVESKAISAAIDADRTQFSEILKRISESSVADAKIKQEISTAASRYKRYDELLADKSDKNLNNKQHLANIATMSEQILTSMHDITMMFEDIVKA